MGVGNGIMTSGDFYVNGACELAGMLQLSAGTASVYLIWSGAGVLTVGSSLTNFWYGTSNGYTGYFGAMDIGAVFSQYVNPIGSVKEVIINAFSSAGDHLVNTTDYAPALHINANGHTTNWGGNIGLGYFDGYMIMNCGTAGCLFTNNGTAIAAVDGSGNYSKISSIKYKTNIDYNVNCDWIYTLKPCTFDWKEPFNGVDQIGLIAEETAEIRKDLVHYNLTGEPDSVYYDKLAIPMLVEMKRLYEEINKLKVELTQLQEEVCKR